MNTNPPGMTLRAYFAAKAMAALLAKPPRQTLHFGPVDEIRGLPDRAYDIADAMLAERERRAPKENP